MRGYGPELQDIYFNDYNHSRLRLALMEFDLWVSGKNEDLDYHLVGSDTPLHMALFTTCMLFQNRVKTVKLVGLQATLL